MALNVANFSMGGRETMMETIWGILACLIAGAASVGIHHRAVQYATRVLPEKSYSRGGAGLYKSVSLLIIAHLGEICVFAIAFWVLDALSPGAGFVGTLNNDARDYFYYSATAYTSLGLGDIHSLGSLRLLTSIETLIGLIMIAWTAAFLFNETSDKSDWGD